VPWQLVYPDCKFTMTQQKKSKDAQQWGADHDSFCLKHQITPSAKLLWQWLLRQGEEGSEIEPDLGDFNQWVKRHRGKEYSRVTLKTALAQLIEHRVVQLIKKYTWKIVKILTRPLEWLKPKKNLPKRNSTYTSPTPNPQSAEEPEYSSSIPLDHPNQVEILAVCANAGIYYDPERPCEVFSYSLDEIRAAVEFYQARVEFGQPIKNPPGWLIDCLRWRYYDQPTVIDRLGMFFDQVRQSRRN
jgi:hypothetical protein